MPKFTRKCVSVDRFDFGGTRPGGAVYCNVYTYDDQSVKTIEFNQWGGEVASYEGEPQVEVKPLGEGQPPTNPPAPPPKQPGDPKDAGPPPKPVVPPVKVQAEPAKK